MATTATTTTSSTTASSNESCLSIQPIRPGDMATVFEMVKDEYMFIKDRKALDIMCENNMVDFFVLLENSQNGEEKVAAVASICKTREGEAMMGNVVVHKDYRSRGLGTRIIKQVLDKYKGDVIIAFYSLADQFYKNLGCQMLDQSGLDIIMLVHTDKVQAYCDSHNSDNEVKTVSFTQDRMDDLVRYDTGVRGYENRILLSLVSKTAKSMTLATTASDQKVVGYLAAVYFGDDHYFIDGLYADDDRIAAALLRNFVSTFSENVKIQFFTYENRRSFLLQFCDEPEHLWNINRFSYGGIPERIPVDRLYCLTQPDVSY